MPAFLLAADDLLRGRTLAVRSGPPALMLLRLVGFVAGFGLLYGAVMGTFGGIDIDRLPQILYSALKVPLLLLVTFLLSLPSFFVLNTLAGVRDDFLEALQALVATQAGLTVLLASLAPFTAFWYVSNADYQSAILFNAFMFAIASFASQVMLARFYRPLIARRPRHRWLLRLWLLLYAFVGIQMGWLLRPFIGNPVLPTGFFRQGAWGNAYVEVARTIWNVLSR